MSRFMGDGYNPLGSAPAQPQSTGYESLSTEELVNRLRASRQAQAQAQIPSSPAPRFQAPAAFEEYAYGGGSTMAELAGPSMGRGVTLTGQQYGTDQAVADVLQGIRQLEAQGGMPGFSQRPWAEQMGVAQRVIQNRGGVPESFQPPLAVEAERAAGRMRAAETGQYQYTPEEQARDQRILEVANQQRQAELNRARAGQLGAGGAFASGAADTASLGLGGLVRGQVVGSTPGLEGAQAQAFPKSTLAGNLAGGLIPGVGAASAGSRAAGLGLRAVAPEAGVLARGAAHVAGGFAGGEAMGAVTAFNQGVGATGTLEGGLEGAQQSITAYPNLIGKLFSGADLDEADALNLAMLLPMYLGTRADVAQVVRQYQASPGAQRAALGRALLQDIEAAQLPVQPEAAPIRPAPDAAVAPPRPAPAPLDFSGGTRVEPAPRITPDLGDAPYPKTSSEGPRGSAAGEPSGGAMTAPTGAPPLSRGVNQLDPGDARLRPNLKGKVDEAGVERWLDRGDPSTWPPAQGRVEPDGSIVITDGNHRVEAARRLGAKLPVYLTGEAGKAAPAKASPSGAGGAADGPPPAFDTTGFRKPPPDDQLMAVRNRLDAGETLSIREVARMIGSPNDIRRAKRTLEAARSYKPPEAAPEAAPVTRAPEPPAAPPTPPQAPAPPTIRPGPGADVPPVRPGVVEPDAAPAPADNLTRARELFGEGDKPSPAVIKQQLGVSMQEALALKNQLMQERRAPRAAPDAAPERLPDHPSYTGRKRGGAVESPALSGKGKPPPVEMKRRIMPERAAVKEGYAPQGGAFKTAKGATATARLMTEDGADAVAVKTAKGWQVFSRENTETAKKLRQTSKELTTERDVARTDALTGLGNKRKYDEALEGYRKQADDSDQPMSVIQFDAANLKAANTVLGHAGADNLLKELAKTLRSAGGRLKDAVITRQGGDEFAVVLPGADEAAAAAVLKRIEEQVGRRDIIPGLSMFLAGESVTYRKGQDLAALLKQGDLGVEAKKAALKQQYGEPTDRAGAEALVAKHLAEKGRGAKEAPAPGGTKSAAGDGPEGVVASPAVAEGRASPVRAKIALRQQGRALADPVSPQGIINRLHADLGLGMPGLGKSRTLKTRALGWIMPGPEAIRLRMADDLGTAAHEVGHFLHKLVFQGGTSHNALTGKRVGKRGVGLDEGRFPAAWGPELEALGQQLYGSRKPAAGYKSEGWAELVRLMFTDPAAAKKAAPTAYKDTVNLLSQHYPEQYAALLRFRRDHAAFTKSDPITKLMGYIRGERVKTPWGRATQGVKDAWERFYDRVNLELFDQTAAVASMARDLARQATGAFGDATKAQAEVAHRTALRARSMAYGDFDTALRRGRFDPATRAVTGKGLAEIIAPVRDALPQWQAYMVAKRALEKRAQGFKGVMGKMTDLELAASVVTMERLYPHFKAAAREFQEFNTWLIEDYAVKSGLLTGAQAKKIVAKNLEYITFAPIKSDAQPSMGNRPGGRKLTETGSGVRRFQKDMEGAGIEPPLQAFMASMEGIMTRAAVNNVAKSITDLEMAEGAGRWFRRIDRPIDASLIRSGEIEATIRKRLEDAGIDWDNDLDQPTRDAIEAAIQMDDFRSFRAGFRVSQATGEFSVLRDGKPVFYEAVHPFLREFLQGKHSPAALGHTWRWLRVPRNVYRAAATARNVDFFVVNFLRDFAQAGVFSRAGKGGVTARWRGILRALKSGDPGALYELSGAGQSGLFQEYMDRSSGRLSLERMFEKPGRIFLRPSEKKVRRTVADLLTLGPIARLNERLELANRLGEFEAVLAGGDRERAKVIFNTDKPTAKQIQQVAATRSSEALFQAGQAAADITLDFQRGGKFTTSVNQVIPFFNAAFLGGNKLYRAAKRDPAGFAIKTMQYTVLPSLISMWLSRNDEDYWNLPYEVRDRYWHFPLGDWDGDGAKEYIRLPKPYGLGIFANMAERAIAHQLGRDPVTGKRGDSQAFRGMAGGILDQFRPPYNVPVVTTVFELMANHSLFFGGPIVRKGEQQGPPGQRGAERSSQLAQALGGLMNVAPPYIDYAIQGLFAGLGTDINRYLVDPSIRVVREGVMGEPPRPRREVSPRQLETLPVLKRLLVEEPKTHSETLIRFWEAFQEVEDGYRGYTQRVNTAARDTDAYFTDHAAEIRGYFNMQPFKENLDELFKQLSAVYRDDALGADERHRKATDLIDQIHDQARQGLINLDKAEK